MGAKNEGRNEFIEKCKATVFNYRSRKRIKKPLIITDSHYETIMHALEKQIPKKPNIITSKSDDGKLACCPVCESNVDWTYEGFWRHGKRKYCHECGQAIDWSE